MAELVPVGAGLGPMPTVRRLGPALREMDPCWGTAGMPRGRLQTEPPPMQDLVRMEQELHEALVPADRKRAAKFGLILVEGWPQRDGAGSQYPLRLADKLAQLPPDLLQPCCDRLMDTCIHRPSIAEVHAVVRELLARRRLMLAKVEAAIRYRLWAEAEEAERRRREAERIHDPAGLEAVRSKLCRLRNFPGDQRSLHREPLPCDERPPIPQGRADARVAAHNKAARTHV